VADAGNIWNVARYLDPSAAPAFEKIPALNSDQGLVTSNSEIARHLLAEFFKPPPEITDEPEEEPVTEELPIEPLTVEEVY